MELYTSYSEAFLFRRAVQVHGSRLLRSSAPERQRDDVEHQAGVWVRRDEEQE